MISSAKSSFIAAFADELRRAREFSGISLRDVFLRTHVLMEYLQALESGRWETIPQPYLRGYLSLYAQAVGMNLDKVLKSFDQLMNTPDDEMSATLDASAPLLSQPEHIGVTRAKIRAGWFTALAQNRRSAYLVLVVTIGVLSGTLYLSRQAQRPQLVSVPFEQTVLEYRETVRGPITHLRHFASDSGAHPSKADSLLIVVVGRDSGAIVLHGNPKPPRTVRYRPYDTLVIYYDYLSYVAITPVYAAIILADGKDSLPPEHAAYDSAYYILAKESSTGGPLVTDGVETR